MKYLFFLMLATFTHPALAQGNLHPILKSLLEFHPTWITRSVTSHDQTGGNDDGRQNGNAKETRDGIEYQTLFHGEGEGRIVRLWMTAGLDDEVPKDYLELRIEADGKTLYRGKPLDFFQGKGPWHYPLVMTYEQSSGGFLSYVPIPYVKNAKILFRGNPHYFQVTYREGLGSSQGGSASELSAFMSDRSWVKEIASLPLASIHTGEVLTSGQVTLSGLHVQCSAADLLDLRIRIGNQAAVPLAFFFGLGSTGSAISEGVWAEVHSELNDFKISGDLADLVTRLPIPLSVGETVSLESGSGKSVSATFAAQATSEHFAGVHLDLQFRNQVGPGVATTLPFYESTAATTFVSLVEEITGNPPGNRRYLEGDEMIRTDQMTYPLQLGTGTEDYFNGGWYFTMGIFTNPNSGEPRFHVIHPEDEWNHADFEHSLYRHHVLDPVVGRQGIRFGFEAGDTGDFTPIRYQTLATAYQFDAVKTIGASTLIRAGDTHSAKMISSRFDSEFNEKETKLQVSTAQDSTPLHVACPSGANAVLLTRTYDAGTSAAKVETISLNTRDVGTFFEAYANPVRRFAQDAVWIDLQKADCANDFQLMLKPSKGKNPGWNAAHYEFQFFSTGNP